MLYAFVVSLFLLSGCGEEPIDFPSKVPVIPIAQGPTAVPTAAPVQPKEVTQVVRVPWDDLEAAEKELVQMQTVLRAVSNFKLNSHQEGMRDNEVKRLEAEIAPVMDLLLNIDEDASDVVGVTFDADQKALIDKVPTIVRDVRKLYFQFDEDEYGY
jgi:hypothetical protein